MPNFFLHPVKLPSVNSAQCTHALVRPALCIAGCGLTFPHTESPFGFIFSDGIPSHISCVYVAIFFSFSAVSEESHG